MPITSLLRIEQTFLWEEFGEYNIATNAYRSALGLRRSDETKHKMSMALRGNQNCKGNILSDETKTKISRANKGRSRSPEVIKQMRIRNTGKKLTEDHKHKISVALSGGKMPPRTLQQINNYRSGTQNYLLSRVGSNRHSPSVLSASDVKIIRWLKREHGYIGAYISKLFNVTPSTIYSILRGDAWGWVE